MGSHAKKTKRDRLVFSIIRTLLIVSVVVFGIAYYMKRGIDADNAALAASAKKAAAAVQLANDRRAAAMQADIQAHRRAAYLVRDRIIAKQRADELHVLAQLARDERVIATLAAAFDREHQQRCRETAARARTDYDYDAALADGERALELDEPGARANPARTQIGNVYLQRRDASLTLETAAGSCSPSDLAPRKATP